MNLAKTALPADPSVKITIITAVYNRAKTVGQAISSVHEQNHQDIEHLIIDGASTDETMEVLMAMRCETMRIISEPDEGIYDALNKGIALATGDVIGIMHSDDFFVDSRVLEKVALAFQNPEIEAVYGDLDYISASDSGRILRRWRPGSFSRRRLIRGWMPPHPTLFLRRSVFERLGGYDTSYRIAADYEAILRYFGKGAVRSQYIPEVFVKMRWGGESNRSIGRILRKSQEDYRALRSNGVGGIGAVMWKNISKVSQFIAK